MFHKPFSVRHIRFKDTQIKHERVFTDNGDDDRIASLESEITMDDTPLKDQMRCYAKFLLRVFQLNHSESKDLTITRVVHCLKLMSTQFAHSPSIIKCINLRSRQLYLYFRDYL